MQVKQIRVGAGRVLNHPTEDYANIRPTVELVAEIDQDENYAAAVRMLQREAEHLVENHGGRLVESLIARDDLEKAKQQIEGLQRQLENSERQSAQLAEHIDELKQKLAANMAVDQDLIDVDLESERGIPGVDYPVESPVIPRGEMDGVAE